LVPSRQTGSRLARNVVALTRPCWWHLLAASALGVLAVPLALLAPVPLMIAADAAVGEQALSHSAHWFFPPAWERTSSLGMLVAALLLLGVACAGSVRSLLGWVVQTYTREKLVVDFRARLLWHVQRLHLTIRQKFSLPNPL
jgi:ATP-binding cassette subfamily B protein